MGRVLTTAVGVALALCAGACSAVTADDVARAPAERAGTTTSAPAPVEGVDVPAAAAPAVREVFVVGDSLTEGAEPWLADAVAARGWVLSGVDARVGRPVPEGLTVLRRRARTLPPTVVVALGTNNLGASDADIEGWVSTARRIVGADRRLVWVNVSAAGSPGRIQRSREINAALAASARRWNVDVLDWEGWTRRHRIATKADGIHYEDGSYRLRALFYAAALPRPTAP